MRTIPGSGLEVFELCLGGNIFGWTADERQSAEVLDAYAAAGGNFIDTADVYSRWVRGHEGGESEAAIGSWLSRRNDRDRFVIATKVGASEGLSGQSIRTGIDASLRRLRCDWIDLYYAHRDDESTPLQETLLAFDELVRVGKVRCIAASNYSAARLEEALRISDELGLAAFVALSPHYNIIERGYERSLRSVCAANSLGCIPYYGLAKGFLTGKYAQGAASPSARGALDGSAHLGDEKASKVLSALEQVADAHGAKPGAVALAWLLAQPTVISPIASARTPEQLGELLEMASLPLSEAELRLLETASAAEG